MLEGGIRMTQNRQTVKPTDIDVAVKDPEYEKRRKEWRLHEINVLSIIGVFLIITIFMLFVPRPTVSAEEQRQLNVRPKFSIESYLDGSFTSEFSAWFNDTVPMRSTWKHFIAGFRSHLGIPYNEAVLHGQLPNGDTSAEVPTMQTTEPTEQKVPGGIVTDFYHDSTEADATEAASTEAASTEAATEEDPEDEEDCEITDSILVVKNRGIMLYGGSFSKGEYYASIVNAYKSSLGDVNVYSMVAPTAVSFYLPKKFASASASETDNIDHINENLKDVTPVDAYAALLPHKDEDIFSRTDHHWAPLGAYYAAQAFAETADVPFADLDSYEKVVKEGYVGTLYGFTNSQDLVDHPEDFIYYVPQNDYTTTYYDIDMTNERERPLMLNLDGVERTSWYLVFMGGDERITHITTDCHNGRTLAIIKDSYGNALVPCLTSSFEDIWVIDMRYFKPNAIRFLKDKGVTDLLFAMNTFSATGQNSSKLETIMNQ